MRRILTFLKRNKPDVLLLSFLLVLVYRAWSTLPQLTIRSDGFFYMLFTNQETYWLKPFPISGIQAAGHMLGAILPRIFGVNLSYYYWLEVFFLLVIAFLFYLLVRVVTKNCLVSFAASLIISVSYFGAYDMVSAHCFCFFFERITIVPFLLISFIFLHLFLESGIIKNYLLSFFFYGLGVGLGYFNLLIVPFYLLYTFFYYFFQKGKLWKRLKGLLFLLPFLLLSNLFVAIHMIRDGGISPHEWTFTSFLLQQEKYLYLKKIGLQFVYWSQFPIFFQNSSENILNSIIDYRQAEFYIPIVLIIYFLAAVTMHKLLPTQRPMILTVVLGIPVIFFLNAYLGQYDMLHFSGASRYLYLPTLLLAIFWAYFLWAVFWRKKNILYIGGFLVLGLYYFINVGLIDGNNHLAVGWGKSTRTIFDYVISTRKKVLPNTLIVVTYPEFGSQESTFFIQQIGRGRVKYISENNLVNARPWEEVASSSAHVLKLHYDEKCHCAVEEKIK